MSFLGVVDRSKGRSGSRSRPRSRADTIPAQSSSSNINPSLPKYETRQPSYPSNSDRYRPRTPGGLEDDDDEDEDKDDDEDEDAHDREEIAMDWNDLPPHERPGYVPPGYPAVQKPYAQAQQSEIKYAAPLEPSFTDYRRTAEAGKAPSGPTRTYPDKSDGYGQYHQYAELPANLKYSAEPASASPPGQGGYTATSRPVNRADPSASQPGYPPYQASGALPYPGAGMPQMPMAGQYGSIEEVMPAGLQRHNPHAVPPPPPQPQDNYGLTRHMSLNGVGPKHRREPSRQSSLTTGMGMLSVNNGNHAPSMYPGMAPPASPLLEAYKGAYQSMPSPLLMPHFDGDLDDLPTLEPRHSNGHRKDRRDSRDTASPPRRSRSKLQARFGHGDVDDLPTLEPRHKKDRHGSRASNSPPNPKRKPRFAGEDHDTIPTLNPRGVQDRDYSDESASGSDGEPVMARPRASHDSREVEAVVPGSKSKHRRSKSYTHSNAKPARSPSRKGRVVMYDAEKDAKTIGAALSHSHVDKQPLTDILPTLSHDQLMELRAAYKKVAKVQGRGINIAKHIKLKTSGSFGKLMYVLALGRWESEGYWANYWYQSHSAKRELLIEALMGRTNQEIKLIKADFQDKRYDDSLTRCMEKELKVDKFRTAVLLALEERRQEEHDVWPSEYVNRDVDTLYDALRRKEGGETAILQIIVTRSDPHLRRVLQTYQRKYESNFAKDALRKSNNLVGEVIAHILNGVINQAARDAMLLQHALADLAADGKGQDRTELLISRLVRMHWEKNDFHSTKDEYRNKFRRDLEDDVAKYVRSEDTREACLGLCEV